MELFIVQGKYGESVAAVKRIPKFEVWNEIRVLSRLPMHTNVIRSFGFEYEKEHALIAMELCQHSLADEIDQQDGIGPLALTKLVKSIKEGFKCLVENNVVHGDIKPDNILVINGIYKLADFGLSSFAAIDERVNIASGTFSYSHPDVFKACFWSKIGLESRPTASFPREIYIRLV